MIYVFAIFLKILFILYKFIEISYTLTMHLIIRNNSGLTIVFLSVNILYSKFRVRQNSLHLPSLTVFRTPHTFTRLDIGNIIFIFPSCASPIKGQNGVCDFSVNRPQENFSGEPRGIFGSGQPNCLQTASKR